MVSKVYLDSYYLLEIVTEGPAFSDVQHLLTKISGSGFEIFIPQIVLGETLTQIFQKYKNAELFSRFEKLGKMVSKYKIDVRTCLPPPSFKKNVFSMMSELKEKDSWLDNTDIIILSHALGDPESKFFFTPDGKILGNQTIIDFEKELRVDKELRNTKLKITDGF